MPDKAFVGFTVHELETLRVALQSAYYSAADEERVLTGAPDGESNEDRRIREYGRTQAARRMQAYHLLTERVINAKVAMT